MADTAHLVSPVEVPWMLAQGWTYSSENFREDGSFIKRDDGMSILELKPLSEVKPDGRKDRPGH